MISKVKTFILMGPPGAGKDTQSKLLSQKTGLGLYSTGERFRELKEKGDYISKRIQEVIDAGELMPHWFPEYLFEEKVLSLSQEEGIVFNGTARTESEAKLVHEVLTWLRRPYKVFFLNVPFEELERRTEIRKKEENRVDHQHFIKRMDEYKEHTVPASDYLRQKGVIIDLDGTKSIEEIQEIISKEVDLLNQ